MCAPSLIKALLVSEALPLATMYWQAARAWSREAASALSHALGGSAGAAAAGAHTYADLVHVSHTYASTSRYGAHM